MTSMSVLLCRSVSSESQRYGQTSKSRRKMKRRHKEDGYILGQGTGSDKLHLQLSDRVIRETNECDISVNGKSCVAPIDTENMLSNMGHSFWMDNHQDVSLHTLDASGDAIPYLGYVEVSLEILSVDSGTYPLLVVRDTPYIVPLLNNVLGKLKEGLVATHGARFLQKSEWAIQYCRLSSSSLTSVRETFEEVTQCVLTGGIGVQFSQFLENWSRSLEGFISMFRFLNKQQLFMHLVLSSTGQWQ